MTASGKKEYCRNYEKVRGHVSRIMPLLEHPATGKIPFPYLLITHGKAAYGGWFCVWDHHHMAMRFACEGKPEYLRHQVENCLHYQESSGFTPNSVSPEDGPQGLACGWHAQPFLAQAAYMYLEKTSDVEWACANFAKLRAYLEYYERNQKVAGGVHCWEDTCMSGVDNDAATGFAPPREIVSPSLSSWLVLEYRAASLIQEKIGIQKEARKYQEKADDLAQKVNGLFWNEEAGSYSARNVVTGKFHFRLGESGDIGGHAFQSCSNLIPLYAGVATRKMADTMFDRYVLSEAHFMSEFGVRSLSKSSEFYNNAVWGNPPRFSQPKRFTNSNWQGPIWVPINYFVFHALLHDGRKAEASDLEKRLVRLLAKTLDEHSTWTENYDAETGGPLYAQDFASWNILSDIMRKELDGKINLMNNLRPCSAI